MKYKWFLIFILSLGIFSLSGCNEAEEILGKVNQLLDQQLKNDESENISNEEESEQAERVSTVEQTGDDATEEEVMSDGHENEADPMLSFDERLQKAGYTSSLDPPNGMPLTLPLDWVLVQIIKEEPWEGVFCFDTPIYDTIAEVEDDLRSYNFDVVSDPIEDQHNLHATKFEIFSEYESWRGDMIYFADDYGTSCTKVYLEYIN